MRSPNTFAILFWVYSSRAKNHETKIYVRITVNGKKVNMSLKYKVDIRIWDAKRQRAKGNSEASRTLNLYLDRVHSQLVQCYQDLVLNGELVTAELIKSNYLGEGETGKSLQELIDYHRTKTAITFAKETIENYGTTEGYLQKFLKKERKTSDIYLKRLDYKFVCDFVCFLHSYWPKGHPKALGHNTVMKHIQRLRKMVTLAYHLEWLDKDPFIRWKSTFEKTHRGFLSENELSNLENYQFLSERLERVRDLFVFSCYTGISYIDLIQLSDDNLVKGIDGYDWIISKRQKTKGSIKVPILEKAQRLLDKYQGHPMALVSGTLFPVITNEKVNFYLKEIAVACGIKKNLTFHMARHTFATTVTLTNGVPIETVSKMLGHTKIATTQIYAKVIERKVSEDVEILKMKLTAQETKRKEDLSPK